MSGTGSWTALPLSLTRFACSRPAVPWVRASTHEPCQSSRICSRFAAAAESDTQWAT